jgi:hypothetical protein
LPSSQVSPVAASTKRSLQRVAAQAPAMHRLRGFGRHTVPSAARLPGRHPSTASHVSLPLHSKASSQRALLAAWVTRSLASSQASSVQATLSFNAGATPARQPCTRSHVSAPLQNRLSLQAALLAVWVTRSLASSQASVVQATLSVSTGATPARQPCKASQVSAPLQNNASLQTALFGVCVTRSLASSQASVVQATLSATTGGAPARQPCTTSHVSAPLQNRLSLQAALLAVWVTRSLASSQASVVQATLSVSAGGDPARQPRAASHVSAPSQNTPLPQGASLGVWITRSLASSHVSTVQATLSVSAGGAPGRQPRAASQVSAPSQNRPLLHAALLATWVIRSLASSQASVVQATLSATTGGAPGRQPRAASHVSAPSQNRPLLQAASLVVWVTRSLASSHASVVQASLSVSTGAAPARQPRTASHVSAPSQNTPLPQAASLVVWVMRSFASSHASAVQATPSVSAGGAPGRQPCTRSHVSAPLQNCASSQRAGTGVWITVSVSSSQVSAVQATPSSSTGGVPARQPRAPSQVSTPLQKRPSSQARSSRVWTAAPVTGSHRSSVQAMPSSVSGEKPGRQPRSASQVSTPSQLRPLSQAAAWGVWSTARRASSQTSAVQATPSSTTGAAPGWHPISSRQTSSPLQNEPSLHRASTG